MEKFITATGKTIDLAIAAALDELHMDRDSVSVEVLDNPKSGFLGIGAQPARVKVTYEVPDEAPKPALSSASRSKPKKPAEQKTGDNPKVIAPAAPKVIAPAAPEAPRPQEAQLPPRRPSSPAATAATRSRPAAPDRSSATRSRVSSPSAPRLRLRLSRRSMPRRNPARWKSASRPSSRAFLSIWVPMLSCTP